MVGTRPRRIASTAISRWLQWLIGLSLSDGFSQVIAITAQICSGVYVAGAPERGASARRSGTDWPAPASRQRLRQYRTVFGHMSSSRALSRTPTASPASKIMRARNANCWDVEWARTNASSASRCAGATITGLALKSGVTKLPSQFPIRDATTLPIRLQCFVTANTLLWCTSVPPYKASRNFRSDVLVHLSESRDSALGAGMIMRRGALCGKKIGESNRRYLWHGESAL